MLTFEFIELLTGGFVFATAVAISLAVYFAIRDNKAEKQD